MICSTRLNQETLVHLEHALHCALDLVCICIIYTVVISEIHYPLCYVALKLNVTDFSVLSHAKLVNYWYELKGNCMN